MYPAGHARNTTADLRDILRHKFNLLGEIAFPDSSDVAALVDQLESLEYTDAFHMPTYYDLPIASKPGYE